MTVVLRYKPKKIVDYDTYQKKWQNPAKSFPSLLVGAPLLVRISGSYVQADDLLDLVKYGKDTSIVRSYVNGIRYLKDSQVPFINWKWEEC